MYQKILKNIGSEILCVFKKAYLKTNSLLMMKLTKNATTIPKKVVSK